MFESKPEKEHNLTPQKVQLINLLPVGRRRRPFSAGTCYVSSRRWCCEGNNGPRPCNTWPCPTGNSRKCRRSVCSRSCHRRKRGICPGKPWPRHKIPPNKRTRCKRRSKTVSWCFFIDVDIYSYQSSTAISFMKLIGMEMLTNKGEKLTEDHHLPRSAFLRTYIRTDRHCD